MATTMPSITLIDQLKHDFCQQHSTLPEHERQQLWLETIGNLPVSPASHHSSQGHNVPRSMANQAVDMTQLLANCGPMNSFPHTQSTSYSSNTNYDNTLHPSPSIPSWPRHFDDSCNAYTVCSDSAPIQRQSPLQSIDEHFPTDGMVEYSPADYVNNFVDPSAPNAPLSHSHSHPHLHVQLTPNYQWMPSLDGSASPSTPSTAALMTPVTLTSNSMSRQSSLNPNFVDMLRVSSDSSVMHPIISDDGSFSFPCSDVNVQPGSISAYADTPHFLDTPGFTGLPSETAFLSPVVSSSASVSTLASSLDTPCLVEDMRRSASTSTSTSSPSTSSESEPSNALASSLRARRVRREREVAHAGRCPIAPKALLSSTPPKPSSNATMMRIQSSDGSSKHVGVISKAPYVRPQHPKMLCPHCSERPEGFRGTHELERHVARAHTAVRKGFICVAPSFDSTFLDACKHCRGKKVYGAYYNAAAHLRRAHFHPRQRGRKGKTDEKRGGIGGGDHPPMDFLRQHWIREIEVDNSKPKARGRAAKSVSPESSSSDSAAEMDMDAQDGEFLYEAPMSMPAVDANAYNFTTGVQIVDSDVMLYGQYAGPGEVPMGDFEFDAYRT